MKELKEYLNQFKEEMPEWLKNYRSGDQVSFKDFMSGRIGYYPGSGEDGCLVSVANKAQCVHCFLYVDYHIKKSRLLDLVKTDGAFNGYHVIGQVDWCERDLTPNGQYPLNVDYKHKKNVRNFMDLTEPPYVFMMVFERDEDKEDNLGAKRFAVTFLFADGIATYYQLFVREYKKTPWLFLLQDHGTGGNYDKFGKGGLLDAIISHNISYPDFVICATNTPIWDGYSKVEDVNSIIGGMHNHQRILCEKK